MAQFRRIEITPDPDSSVGVFYVATMDDFAPCVLAADELLALIAMTLFSEKVPWYLSRPKSGLVTVGEKREAE